MAALRELLGKAGESLVTVLDCWEEDTARARVLLAAAGLAAALWAALHAGAPAVRRARANKGGAKGGKLF